MYNQNPPPYNCEAPLMNAPVYPSGPQGGDMKMYNQNPPPYNCEAPVMNAPVYPSGPQGVVTGAPSVVISTVSQVVLPPLTDAPGRILCPHCQRIVITRTSFEIGGMAWLVCCGIALLGCWLCMCIPFCVDSCKDVKHYCPSCNHVVHIYRRL